MNSLVGFIGRRYFMSGSRHRFASVVSVVSFSGLVLGVMALTVVVSVMNGFDRELRQRILGAMPHVVVTAEHPAGVLQELSGFPGIAAAPFADGQVLLSVGNASMLVAVQGVVPSEEARVSTIPGSMVRGGLDSLSPDTMTIVLGEGVARRMQLLPGDRVNVIVPRLSEGGQLVRPLLRRAEVTGIFSLGSELDYGVAVMHRDVLLEMTGAQPLVRLNLPDVFSAPAVSAQLAAAGYTVRDWTDTYGDFFEAVRMEKIMMFVLLSFVIAVASFSIVSGLSMLVDTKRGDIAVLRTMGMAPGGILGIFLYQGAGIAVLGVLVGLVLGVPLAYGVPTVMAVVAELSGFSIVEGTYFAQIPTDVRLPDILVIALVSLLISMAATIYPSARAARLEPARILRYE